jgi:hypothetical protein
MLPYDFITKQAGAELCQDQIEFEQAKIEIFFLDN